MTNKKSLKFHTEKRKVRDLVPYDLNPRKLTDKQQEELRKSIEKFGLAEIPVIDTDNTICAGHQRVATMLLLGRGEEEVDVRVPNRKLTEEEFNEYNIRSNKNTGEWDWDILNESQWYDKLTDWGFSEVEIFEFGNDEDQDSDLDAEESKSQPKGYSINYEIVFNNEGEQQKWLSFLKKLKDRYPELITISERLIQYIEDHE